MSRDQNRADYFFPRSLTTQGSAWRWHGFVRFSGTRASWLSGQDPWKPKADFKGSSPLLGSHQILVLRGSALHEFWEAPTGLCDSPVLSPVRSLSLGGLAEAQLEGVLMTPWKPEFWTNSGDTSSSWKGTTPTPLPAHPQPCCLLPATTNHHLEVLGLYNYCLVSSIWREINSQSEGNLSTRY